MRYEEFIFESDDKETVGEKNLIGLIIRGNKIKAKITSKTPDQDWNDNFNCSSRGLNSLYGFPKTVSGDFHCEYNYLVLLQGSPQTVGGNFDCMLNNLTLLEGSREWLKKDFVAPVISLKHCAVYHKQLAGILNVMITQSKPDLFICSGQISKEN